MSDNKHYLLAIDNGTQSVRALVFDPEGQLVAKSQVVEEPSLFAEIEEQHAEADDGLPLPAYRPQAEPVRQQPAAQVSRPVPGTPTPEALARLERVTGRAAQFCHFHQ